MSSPTSGQKKNKAPPKPKADDSATALGNAPPRTGLAFREKQQQAGSINSSGEGSGPPIAMTSLVEACRHSITTNLERYPPESLGILDEAEWNLLLEYRHQKTKPKQGQGGLDGTGRIAPALTDKFMTAVEECNPLFATSEIADLLIWKDCTNYTFRKGGLTRPNNLLYPWPLLLKRIQDAGQTLLEEGAITNNLQAMEDSLKLLEKIPMNVSLLMATGIGKTVKKAIKKQSKHGMDTSRLEALLASLKSLAQDEGVKVSGSKSPTKRAAPSSDNNADIQKDWQLAEQAQNWRQLFAALQQRESTRRQQQGQRMREIRGKLNSVRPKVVKVRPANKMSTKHERILNYAANKAAGSSPDVKGGAKLAQLKREAIVQSSRQNRGQVGNNQSRSRLASAMGQSTASTSMFSMAVAGAAGSKTAHRKRGPVMTAQTVMKNGKNIKRARKGGVGSSAPSSLRYQK